MVLQPPLFAYRGSPCVTWSLNRWAGLPFPTGRQLKFIYQRLPLSHSLLEGYVQRICIGTNPTISSNMKLKFKKMVRFHWSSIQIPRYLFFCLANKRHSYIPRSLRDITPAYSASIDRDTACDITLPQTFEKIAQSRRRFSRWLCIRDFTRFMVYWGARTEEKLKHTSWQTLFLSIWIEQHFSPECAWISTTHDSLPRFWLNFLNKSRLAFRIYR